MIRETPFGLRGNGKLLLSGEYLVLYGARALAIPTRYGQSFHFEKGTSEGISWNLKVKGEEAFSAEMDVQANVVETSGLDFSKRLSEILKKVMELTDLNELPSLEISSECDFPLDWGLGTSSTLIYALSDFFGIDPYALLERTFGGSGYDIACAGASGPGIYRLSENGPVWEDCEFNPGFSNLIHFIHLNRKKDSREAIAHFKDKMKGDGQSLISRLNELTHKMLFSREMNEFAEAMRSHEELLSDVLGLPAVGEELFADYEHATKSLGGWGGDFIMALGDAAEMDYFRRKGYETIIPFDKMILKRGQ